MTGSCVELARNGELAIYRRTGLTPAEFSQQHLVPGVPVVIGDATDAWAAKALFTPAFFRQHYSDAQVKVGSYGALTDQPMQLGEVLDLLEAASAERPAPYPCKLELGDRCTELLSAISPRPAIMQPDYSHHWLVPRRLRFGARAEVFFGSPGGLFPYLHIDFMGLHAFISQLYGHKEFVAIPPSQIGCVYPDPERPWVSAMDNHHAPDLKRFPRYADATPLRFSIGPGDTLFIPNGWWHTAHSLDVTISVAQDLLNASNWGRFVAEVKQLYPQRWKANAAAAYLGLARLALGRV